MNLPDGNAGGFPAVDALDQPHATDAAVATVSAITNLIPILGGALAASLSEWRLHVATNRLVAALEEIRRAIEAVQDDVDRHGDSRNRHGYHPGGRWDLGCGVRHRRARDPAS